MFYSGNLLFIFALFYLVVCVSVWGWFVAYPRSVFRTIE